MHTEYTQKVTITYRLGVGTAPAAVDEVTVGSTVTYKCRSKGVSIVPVKNTKPRCSSTHSNVSTCHESDSVMGLSCTELKINKYRCVV
mgnify:CR=1 FL=1